MMLVRAQFSETTPGAGKAGGADNFPFAFCLECALQVKQAVGKFPRGESSGKQAGGQRFVGSNAMGSIGGSSMGGVCGIAQMDQGRMRRRRGLGGVGKAVGARRRTTAVHHAPKPLCGWPQYVNPFPQFGRPP